MNRALVNLWVVVDAGSLIFLLLAFLALVIADAPVATTLLAAAAAGSITATVDDFEKTHRLEQVLPAPGLLRQVVGKVNSFLGFALCVLGIARWAGLVGEETRRRHKPISSWVRTALTGMHFPLTPMTRPRLPKTT